MAFELYIAEKKEVATAIAKCILPAPKIVGNSYYDCGRVKVIWCSGRMLALCEPEDYDAMYKKWHMSHLPIKIARPWKKKVVDRHKHQVNMILKLIGEAHTIINAGDVDEMGQLIVDELIMLAGKGRTQGKAIKRVLVDDNSPKAVQRALSKSEDNAQYHGLYLMAESQSLADQNFGFNLSRAYTLAANTKTPMSVGRVQTPILGLIVRRDLEKKAHVKSYYYTLATEFTFGLYTLHANYLKKEGDPFDEKGRMLDPKFFETIADRIRDQKCVIQNKKIEQKQTLAPLPYSLLKLQGDASDLLGISMQETLEITQNLRTKHALITYNRSTCEYLNEERHEEAPDVLKAIQTNLSEFQKITANPNIKGRAFDSAKVDAHHAIIPTETIADMRQLSEKERALYALIAQRYIAQFYPPYRYEETRLLIHCQAYHFVAVGHKPMHPGWKALYHNEASSHSEAKDPEDSDDALKENALDLSGLAIHDQGVNTHAQVEKKATKPKPHYTEKTLLNDLTRVANYVKDPKLKQILKDRDKHKKGEHGGIGTPATRAEIIKTLVKRGFITVTKKTVKSTELGQKFYEALPDSVKYPDMTAIWHEQQEGIRKGTLPLDHFLNYLEQFIAKEIEQIKNTPGYIQSFNQWASEAEEQTSKFTCPSCGSSLQKRKGEYGLFWSCTGYPTCKQTFKNDKNKPVFLKK